MIQKFFGSLLLIHLSCFSHAQEKEIYIVKPGEKVTESLPDSVQFTYPSFTMATISFRDGRSGTAKLNYNSLFEEMMFIDPKGDTLAIGNLETIRHVVFNKDTFFLSDILVKQVASYGDVLLGQRIFFRVINVRKPGAMGHPTSNTVQSFRAMNTASDLRSLVVMEEITLEKSSLYYLGDRFGKFSHANRNTLFEMFPQKRKQIKEYLKENNTSFTSETDLKKLLKYIYQN